MLEANNNLANKPVVSQETQTADVPIQNPPEQENSIPENTNQETLNSLFDIKPKAKEEPKKKSESMHDFFKEFISQKLLKLTTLASVAVNLISAPVRLYDDDNPLKKLINKISMFLTKSHLLTYSASGLNNAIKEKNPFLLFSFAVEGLSALFGLRQIYLFRGIASGVDGAIAGIQDRSKHQGKSLKHNNYVDSFKDYFNEIMKVTKEFFANPMQTLTRSDGVHKGVMSSWLMIIGSFFGLTVNDSIGAGFRDGAGAVNDYSLIEYESTKAKTSGAFYLSGSIFDFAAHLFGMSDKYKQFRNVFHEVAIALDRVGQYLFLRYLEESEEEKSTPKVDVIKNMHQNTMLKTQERYLNQMAA